MTEAGGRSFAHLDMVRGLAAIVVCVGHARGFLLVDYARSGGGKAAMLFYTLTGLHHEAVMVFFALSGFLVGGSVLRSLARGQWSWSAYLWRRLCRLWVVIVPALLLTLLWDRLGAAIDPAAYRGAYHGQLLSGPSGTFSLSAATFVGNLFFLQTLAVPAFGSNGPLWSLANEFWYYILFPLAATALLLPASTLKRAAAGLAFVALLLILPTWITVLGLVWLFGVAAYVALERPALRAVVATPWCCGIGAAALAVALLASRLTHAPGIDYAIGAAFAVTLPWLTTLSPRGAWYRRASAGLSDISYSLYLVHFPLLAFLYFWLLAPAQLPFAPRSVLTLALVVAGAIAYATAIWWMFERNTDRVRTALQRRFARRG